MWMTDLLSVQQQIQAWYMQVAEKIQHQSRLDEFQASEQTRIYHHELHKKHVKKSSILKLLTDSGLLEGLEQCAEYLEGLVADLLLHPAEHDQAAQAILLNEIDTVVTDAENEMLLAMTRRRCMRLSKLLMLRLRQVLMASQPCCIKYAGISWGML